MYQVCIDAQSSALGYSGERMGRHDVSLKSVLMPFDSYVPYDIGNITGRRECVYNVVTKASKSDVNIGPLYIIVAE
jgi:hypothetical protein